MHKYKSSYAISDVRSRLLTAPTEEQIPIQSISNTNANVVIPQNKNITLFSDSTPQGMRIKKINFQLKEERIHLKAFPAAKSN